MARAESWPPPRFLIGLGTLATITMKHPWQLIALWGVVVGCGTGIIAIVLGATVVQRWFYLHRGLALGLLTASSATGQLVFLPVLAQLVVSSGWRWAVDRRGGGRAARRSHHVPRDARSSGG